MTNSGDELSTAIDEFTARLRQGEVPAVTEYVRRFPDLDQELRELLPTIAALEQAKRRHHGTRDGRAALGAAAPKQLGDFRLLREIGRGGMGIVYLAEQLALGRMVAIKVLPHQTVVNPRRRELFQREARAAARLHHTNIVPVFGVGEQLGFHFLVMQYIAGVGLDEVVRRLRAARRLDPQLLLGTQTVTDLSGDLPGGPTASVARHPATVLSNTAPLSELFSAEGSVSAVMSSNAVSPAAVRSVAAKSVVPASAKMKSATGSAPPNGHLADSEPAETDSSPEARSGSAITTDSGPLTIDTPQYWSGVARVGLQVADALHFAHEQGVLHRDIKPGNILMDAQGTAWVLDFGLATVRDGPDISQSGELVGTMAYLAPERLERKADVRSDVYSLGLTLYELLTLRRAHVGQTPEELLAALTSRSIVPPRNVVPAIPRDLEAIVLKACHRQPDQRYSTAAELRDDLQRFLDDRPTIARRLWFTERFRRWCRRNPWTSAWASLTTLSAVLVFLSMTYAYWQNRAAFLQSQASLNAEAEYRQQSDNALGVSLEMLDEIYSTLGGERRLSSIPGSTMGATDRPPVTHLAPPSSTPTTGQPVTAAAITSGAVTSDHAVLLADLLRFYDRLATKNNAHPKLQLETAKALRRVGDIRRRLGQSSAALEAYEQAIEKFQAWFKHRASPEILLELGRAECERGRLLSLLRREVEAQRSFEGAEARLSAITTQDRTPDMQFELARVHFFLGHQPRHEVGPDQMPRPQARASSEADHSELTPDAMPPRDRPEFQPPGPPPRGPRPPGPPPFDDLRPPRPRDPERDRLGQPPGRPPAPGDRPPPRHGPGQPPPPADRPGRRPSPPGFDSPSMSDPDDPANDTNRAVDQAGPDLSSNPRHQHLRQAIDLVRPLVERTNAAPARLLLALCLRDLNLDPASTERADAITLLRQLQQEYPTVADYQFELCETLAELDARPRAWTAIEIAEAEQRLTEAERLAEQLVAGHPDEPDYRSSLAHVHFRVGNLLWHIPRSGMPGPPRHRGPRPGPGPEPRFGPGAGGEPPPATVRHTDIRLHLTRAVELERQLVERWPDSLSYRLWLVRMRARLALYAEEIGRSDDAFEQLTTAWQEVDFLAARIERDYPDGTGPTQQVSTSSIPDDDSETPAGDSLRPEQIAAATSSSAVRWARREVGPQLEELLRQRGDRDRAETIHRQWQPPSSSPR